MKNYAQRVADDRQKFLSVGTDFGCQMMADYVAIALNDPDVMGSNTLGEERLQRLFEKVHEIDRFYDEAFTSSPEADVMQEKLDARLQQIYKKGEFVPFMERYPFIKQFRYGRKKR